MRTCSGGLRSDGWMPSRRTDSSRRSDGSRGPRCARQKTLHRFGDRRHIAHDIDGTIVCSRILRHAGPTLSFPSEDHCIASRIMDLSKTP